MDTQRESIDLKTAKRVLVPVDLSPLSYQALDLALNLTGPDTQVRLFHASPPVYTVVYGGESVPASVYDRTLSANQLERAKTLLAKETEYLKGRVEAEVTQAREAPQAIVQAARRFQAEYVVMTTHGRGGLSRLLSGSVAQKLFHLYAGPIVLLRPKGRPRP